jgi:hypothetical protein
MEVKQPIPPYGFIAWCLMNQAHGQWCCWNCLMPQQKYTNEDYGPLGYDVVLFGRYVPNYKSQFRRHIHRRGNLKSRKKKKTPSPDSANELFRPSNRRLSVKLVSTLMDRGVSRSQRGSPTTVISVFLDRSRYFFFQVAPQLYSRVWVDPVPDPLLLRKSGKAENRTRTSRSVARSFDH